MATSGNYTLALIVTEAANSAFGLLQTVGDGEAFDGDHLEDFMSAGNLVMKEWQTQGAHLWGQTEGTLFLTKSQSKYDFRLSAVKLSNEWFETTTTAATTANAYSFPVTSASNIVAGDTIGIIQNDNDLFWTTVTRKSSLTITLADPIPLATVSGATVRNFRDTFIPISRIDGQEAIRRKEPASEIPIFNSSRSEYFGLPNKSSTGTPMQAYYDRQDVAGERYGVMYLWPTPNSSSPIINFTYERKLQIMTDAEETIDLPEYAQEAFIFNVAKRLILKYGCSPDRAIKIETQAQILKEDMLSFDVDYKPIKVRIRRHA